MSEHQEQAALFELLARNETKYPFLKFIFAIPNGGHRSKAAAGKMKAEGVKRGVFDIFVPIPSATGMSAGLFIEIKVGTNRLTKEQEEFQYFAWNNDFQTAVCYSWVEAVAVIEGYLKIKLTA